MNTHRLRQWLRDLPISTRERDAIKLVALVLGPRLLIAFVLLVIWSWIRLHYVKLEPRSLDRLVELTGTLLIFGVAVYPLLHAWVTSLLNPTPASMRFDYLEPLPEERDPRP